MGVGGQRHAASSLPAGKRPCTHCVGGWVGPRAVVDRCGRSHPHWDSIPGPSSPYRVAVPTTLSRPIPTIEWQAEIEYAASPFIIFCFLFHGEQSQWLNVWAYFNSIYIWWQQWLVFPLLARLDVPFLGLIAKLRKATISFVMSVCPSAPIGRIFMKFDIWALIESLSRKFKFH
jgi:hypothetical protein